MKTLLLMNDPQFVECTRGLAQRAMIEGGTSPLDRACFILKQCVFHSPQPDEVNGLLADYEEHLLEYKADPESAMKLFAIGEESPGRDLGPEEVAAWTMVANLVQNLDEVINK